MTIEIEQDIIENFEKIGKLKFFKKNLAKRSSGIKIYDIFKSKGFEVMQNRIYAKFSKPKIRIRCYQIQQTLKFLYP